MKKFLLMALVLALLSACGVNGDVQEGVERQEDLNQHIIFFGRKYVLCPTGAASACDYQWCARFAR